MGSWMTPVIKEDSFFATVFPKDSSLIFPARSASLSG